MKAIVMAGGIGSRLFPMTKDCPKPLLPVVNKPVLAHILDLLKYHHITDVIITVQYLADHIRAYFGNGRHLGMKLRYVVEETPLGTAGGVKNAEPYLDDEPFLVISGDIITDLDLSRLLQFHHRKQALATLALKGVADPRQYGLVVADDSGRIHQYLEKPNGAKGKTHSINTGVYILEPDILALMKPNTAYDFSRDIFPYLLRRNAPFFGHLSGAYWCDMGTIPGYRQVIADVLRGKVSAINLGPENNDGIWLGHNVHLASDVALHRPIYVAH
jgi:mannose-1-phosphate guanylyltransferase/phosphomannomutase